MAQLLPLRIPSRDHQGSPKPRRREHSDSPTATRVQFEVLEAAPTCVTLSIPRTDGPRGLECSFDNQRWKAVPFPKHFAGSTHRVKGLKPRTTYFFRIRSDVSSGGASKRRRRRGQGIETVVATTPALLKKLPSPEKPFVQRKGTEELSLSWQAPEGTKEYELSVARKDGGEWHRFARKGLSAGPGRIVHELGGLTPGKSHMIRLRMRSALDWSASSEILEVQTRKMPPPPAPQLRLVALRATHVQLQVHLPQTTLKNQDEPLGSLRAIKSYCVYLSSNSGRSWKRMGECELSAQESNHLSWGGKINHTLEFLESSSEYQVCLTLKNATLWGPRSVPLSFQTPRLAAPMAPPAPRIREKGVNELIIEWDEAYQDYATEYEVQAHESLWERACRKRTSATSAVIAGLKAATNYLVRYKVRNACGWGSVGEWATVRTRAPQMPERPLRPECVLSTPTKLVLACAPAFDGGAPVLEYEVCARISGRTHEGHPLRGGEGHGRAVRWTQRVKFPAQSKSEKKKEKGKEEGLALALATIGNLPPDSMVDIVARCRNEVGWSATSDPMQRFYTRKFCVGDRVDFWWDGPFVKEEAWYPFTIVHITPNSYILQSEDVADTQVKLAKNDYKFLRERDVEEVEKELLGFAGDATEDGDVVCKKNAAAETSGLIQALIVDNDITIVNKKETQLKPESLPLAFKADDFPAPVKTFQSGTLSETLIEHLR